jgi:hypothetical protein
MGAMTPLGVRQYCKLKNNYDTVAGGSAPCVKLKYNTEINAFLYHPTIVVEEDF